MNTNQKSRLTTAAEIAAIVGTIIAYLAFAYVIGWFPFSKDITKIAEASPTVTKSVATTLATHTPTATRESPTATFTTKPTDMPRPSATPTLLSTSTPPLTSTSVGSEKRLDVIRLPDGTYKELYITDIKTNTSKLIFGDKLVSAAWTSEGEQMILSRSKIGLGTILMDGSGLKSYSEFSYFENNAIAYRNTTAASFLRHVVSYADVIWSPSVRNSVALLMEDESGNKCPSYANIENKSIRKFTYCERDDHPRYWSVDGKWIIAWSERGLRLYAYEADGNRRVPLEQIGKIQVYDQRYWPWRVTDSPICKGASFWECE